MDKYRERAGRVMTAPRPDARTALQMANQLIGSWPHARADKPEIYGAAIAAALRDYPGGIAAECCDPRTGLAREREMMPTVVAVHDWCRARMQFYRPLMRPTLATKKEG